MPVPHSAGSPFGSQRRSQAFAHPITRDGESNAMEITSPREPRDEDEMRRIGRRRKVRRGIRDAAKSRPVSRRVKTAKRT